MNKTQEKLICISYACAVISIAILAIMWLNEHVAHGQEVDEEDPTTILTVGDLSCSHRSLQTMTSAINYLQTHIVGAFVFLGDAQYGNTYDECVSNFFKEVAKYTALRIVQGNHDNEIWQQIIADHEQPPGPVWHIIVKDTLLIGMNTEAPWRTNSTQYKQVYQALKFNDAEYKLVFMHNPTVFSCTNMPSATQALCGHWELYKPLFMHNGVNCVIAAHKHQLAIIDDKGFCVAIYGMGGAAPYSDADYPGTVYGSKQSGFAVIKVYEDKLSHNFYANNAGSYPLTTTTEIDQN